MKQLADSPTHTTPGSILQENNGKHLVNGSHRQSFIITVTDPDANQTKIDKYLIYKNKSDDAKRSESISYATGKVDVIEKGNKENQIIYYNTNNLIAGSGQNPQLINNNGEELGINKVYIHDDGNSINASPISKPNSPLRNNSIVNDLPKSSPVNDQIDGQLNKVASNYEYKLL